MWSETLHAIGSPPVEAGQEGPLWVSVGDRGSDFFLYLFLYLREARLQGWHCLVRACQDRRLEVEGDSRRR